MFEGGIFPIALGCIDVYVIECQSNTFSCFFSAYLPKGSNDTGHNDGFTARPDCAVHRPSPLGPRFSLALLAYLWHRSHVLTPVWLRSQYRSLPVDPLSCCFFFGEIAFGGMPSLRT